jgi:hypothetical protein
VLHIIDFCARMHCTRVVVAQCGAIACMLVVVLLLALIDFIQFVCVTACAGGLVVCSRC